mmetsp:Transcript_7086/g.17106  ORF Transcript_7086/g.17106 Transcript_7086/m.17106 type:complete len:463 (-) Transcript_7086:233-1621(-)
MKSPRYFLVWGGLFLGGAAAFSQHQHVWTTSTTIMTKGLRAATVNIDEGATREVWAMDEYMTSCGVQRAEGLSLYESGTQASPDEYGLMTQTDLPAESPVLCVPSEMIFSSEELRQGELKGLVDAAEETLLVLGVTEKDFPMFHLFLKILIEHEKGDESPWFPWLNSLPRRYSNGASMTPYCFECLPPLVANLATKERVRFIHFYNALSQLRFLNADTKKDKELAKWAYNVVYTRSFGNHNGEGMEDPVKRIVPMADMFDHTTETEVDISFDDDGNCYAYTNRDVPGGSPLRMSYGCPTNPSHLFATYGFLDETSPATFCKIMNIEATQELRNIGLDFSRMLFYKDTGDITEEVWDVLLYTILEDVDDDERQTQRAFYKACMSGDVDTKNAIHHEYFHKTARVLQIHVDSFLQNLDRLEAKAATKNVVDHPRIPIILEHNEFVKQTFLRVKENVDAMAGQMA